VELSSILFYCFALLSSFLTFPFSPLLLLFSCLSYNAVYLPFSSAHHWQKPYDGSTALGAARHLLGLECILICQVQRQQRVHKLTMRRCQTGSTESNTKSCLIDRIPADGHRHTNGVYYMRVCGRASER
jgi:hypothetical protein